MQLNANKDLVFIILTIETIFVIPSIIKLNNDEILEGSPLPKWDCSNFLDDKSGRRFIEEILRRVVKVMSTLDFPPDAICLSLPGTLKGTSTILRSNRLCIQEPFNVSDFFLEKGLPNCFVLHDTECLGLGEAKYGALKDLKIDEKEVSCFAYLLVDEGVGSTLFIDGKAFNGAGSAGHIGRLVVDPRGQYNPTFLSRGCLEVFASRPWVSKNIVGGFLSEIGKPSLINEEGKEFRDHVLTAAQNEQKWNSLPYWIISKGLECRDPIAISVIEDAAMYLGLAINCVMSVAHPPAVIVGGEMIKELPGFYESVLSYARRFSWALAWNRTVIKPAELGRKAQVLGAIVLLKKLIKK